ncbi:hypothetical protein [uncultured Pseudoteredinibacter sp.]|uniref:hypothetical protein n=1 Tax=uncultured Pseudoteredinibacter sp. TaxID=1641701 RepID=UPI002638E245|nr:hypothetical protein [uncultured Pseudoteredinibacter sp.]
MKKIMPSAFILLALNLVVMPTFAHDPALHKLKEGASECEAKKGMDHSKGDASHSSKMKNCKKAVSDSEDHSRHEVNKVKIDVKKKAAKDHSKH